MDDDLIDRAARALASRRVYGGYNAETRARMIEREMYGARLDVKLALDIVRESLWEALKEAACVNPKDARRIVMLDKATFDAALGVTEPQNRPA